MEISLDIKTWVERDTNAHRKRLKNMKPCRLCPWATIWLLPNTYLIDYSSSFLPCFLRCVYLSCVSQRMASFGKLFFVLVVYTVSIVGSLSVNEQCVLEVFLLFCSQLPQQASKRSILINPWITLFLCHVNDCLATFELL